MKTILAYGHSVLKSLSKPSLSTTVAKLHNASLAIKQGYSLNDYETIATPLGKLTKRKTYSPQYQAFLTTL